MIPAALIEEAKRAIESDRMKAPAKFAREWRKKAATGRAITRADSAESPRTPHNAPTPTSTTNDDPDQAPRADQAAPVVSLRSPSRLTPRDNGTTPQPKPDHRSYNEKNRERCDRQDRIEERDGHNRRGDNTDDPPSRQRRQPILREKP